MAEWLYEDGIGESRAALIDDGEIVAARIRHESALPRLGAVIDARLIEGGRMPRVMLADGGEALLVAVPAGLTQGAALTVEIVREAIPERGRPKLPRARAVAADTPRRDGPDLLTEIEASGLPVRHLRAHEPDALEAAGWSELIEEAITGEIAFPGGALRMAVTPAMTLFDVDGDADPLTLALAGAAAGGRAVRRMDIGGSIGIDFPTLPDKAARARVDAAIDAAMPAPFERTAINGFGFMQVVRPRPRASLPEMLAADPAGQAARALLRRIERTPPPGVREERVARPLKAVLDAHPHWLSALARRTGRTTDFQEE